VEITFYQSECGDAAKLSFLGNDNEIHNIFIDSGYERTFRDIIKKEIIELTHKNEKIDYWIISHIHDDHIGGVKKYIDYIKDGEMEDIVSNWIYNAPRFYKLDSSDYFLVSNAKSIGQGDILYNYLKSIGKMEAIDYITDSKSINIAGLNITFLSPTIAKLKDLRNKYSISKMEAFESIEDDSISEAVGIVKNDYQTKIFDFSLKDWKEDDNIENGSSISFITEIDGKNVLWLADSHPSDIVESLINIGYSSENKIKCDWVKVAHHGSKGNNNNELYDLIECNNYLFSANGENRSKLPTKECIARILRNKNRNLKNKYKLYFTYDNDTLQSIFQSEEDTIYNDLNFEVIFSKENLSKFNLF